MSAVRGRKSLPLSYRLSVLSRAVAAIAGGYALSTAASLLLINTMSTSRAAAVLTGLLSSFTFYVCAVIWAFAAATATRAWLGIAGTTLLCTALWWITRA